MIHTQETQCDRTPRTLRVDRGPAPHGKSVTSMVVEFLTFTVPPAELTTWLEVKARHWTRFLERQDGFVRKEMWRSAEDPTSVHAVVLWTSTEQWKAIPQADLDAVAAAMGPHERHAECAAFDVLGTA